MSVAGAERRLSVRHFRKDGGPYVCLTAYTTPMARLLDPHADLLLVGDSLGMVLYGLETTVPVTLEMMIAHGAAVMRGTRHACVVVDMPFGSYQESPQLAFRNAAKLMAETDCAAVKLEGGRAMAETIRFLTERGIPVCGHVGLMPQAVKASGYRVQGRDAAGAAGVAEDAQAVAAAGAFAVVIEGTTRALASAITRAIPVPTIGIGASPDCDGQILVSDDMLGLFTTFTPRFVKRYADLGAAVSQAAASYAEDVRARKFPAAEHCVDVPAVSQRSKARALPWPCCLHPPLRPRRYPLRPHEGGKILHMEGFLQNPLRLRLRQEIAGDQHHLHLRPAPPDLLGQFQPRHAGHPDIGDHHGDAVVAHQHRQRLLAAGGGQHGVAEILQRFRQDFAHLLLVVDDQDSGRRGSVRTSCSSASAVL